MAPTFLCNVGTCFVYFEAEGKLANKVTGNNNVEKLRNWENLMDIEEFSKTGLYLHATTAGSQDI